MGIKAVALTLRTRFNTDWLLSEIVYQNMDATKQQDAAKQAGTGWVRFNVLPGVEDAVGIGGDGSTLYRGNGTILVEIYTLINRSQELAEEWADAISTIFRGKDLEPQITCYAPTISVVGSEQAWYHVNVAIPFDYDQQLVTL